jgi:uncharacterized repeat protein (TIGR02543 family)
LKMYGILPILLLLLMSFVIPIFKTYADSTTLAINPPDSYVTINKTVNVDVNVSNVINLTSWQFTAYFLNSILNCTNVVEGPFLKTGGSTFFNKTITNNFNSTHGKVLAYSTLLGLTDVDGSGVLATITFSAIGVGDSTIHLTDTKLGDEQIPPQPIAHTTTDGTVHVQNFILTISTVGTGSVTLNNTGPYYHYGEAVSFTAVPAIGWSFSAWSGDLIGSTNPSTLIITGNMSVTATFTQDQYTLTITISGSGSVAKSPDQATYTWGTNVTLTATANTGWSFAGWSGDASGTNNPTTVNMTGNKAVTATFTQNVYTLTTSIIGSGSINVNYSGPYHYGDIVQLTAVPAIGWSFDHWSGDASGATSPTNVNMTGNKAVTATFTQNVYTLTTNVIGQGSISRNNTGPYHYGDVVQLTAVPSVGWSFSFWSDGLSGSANPTTLTITGDVTVNATFTRTVYTLSVSTSGSGSVNLNNTGPYYYGDVVQLTATATIGWSFANWTGDVSGTANPTNVNMTSNKSVTAHFAQNNYTITVTTVGSGSVTPNASSPYHYGDTVVLTAAPQTNWVFHYWTGDLTGSTNPATLVITSNFSVTAYFLQKPSLQMNPSSKTCRIYSENFTVAVTLSNAVNVKDFDLEIHYNTTLLDYASITWNIWGPGIITVNEGNGVLYLYASGTAFNGTQTLVTIRFQAACYHVWKGAPGWINNLTDTIFIQRANISYVIGPDLNYEKGGSDEIAVGPDFSYTFSPIQGDVNNDGTVDLFDLRTVAIYIDVTGDSTYDLDGNGVIDVFDLRVVAANYGYTYTP